VKVVPRFSIRTVELQKFVQANRFQRERNRRFSTILPRLA